jgi:hypothetical protein
MTGPSILFSAAGPSSLDTAATFFFRVDTVVPSSVAFAPDVDRDAVGPAWTDGHDLSGIAGRLEPLLLPAVACRSFGAALPCKTGP